MNTKPVYIGVDPAFRKGGFWASIVDMSDRTVAHKCFADVLEWHDWLRSDEAPESCFVCVENSNLQNKTFAYASGGTKAHSMKMSRNVGANQAVSQLAYYSAVRRYGKDRVFEVSPETKGGKWTKKQAGYILKSEHLTVITDGENQDSRDALKLALIAVKKVLWNGVFVKTHELNYKLAK